MILVKFWFWSFWFFRTQRDYAAGRFGAMGFPQHRRRISTEENKGNEEFPLGFLRLLLFTSSRVGPAFARKLRRGKDRRSKRRKMRQAGSAVLRYQRPSAFICG